HGSKANVLHDNSRTDASAPLRGAILKEVIMSEQHKLSRREALEAMMLLGAVAVPAAARIATQSSGLPLNSPGLEHIGLTVTNPEETAKFYGRIFNPQLFRERDAPPRFYVTTGTAYLAFGGNANATPRIDHFCALVEDY